MAYYVILSDGCYSDYEAQYYVGDTEITDEELQRKGAEVGDKLYDWFKGLPLKRYKPATFAMMHLDENELQRYDEITDNFVFEYELKKEWDKTMINWLHEKGFTALPKDIPEINISYSDLPTSKDKEDENGD